MKKHYTIIHNQQGFLLFHVVWVILIVFLCIHFLLYQYQTERVVVNNQLFHIETETLFQMAYKKARDEIDNKEVTLPHQTTYDFPQGEVKVTMEAEPDDKIAVYFAIKQTGSDHIYQLSRRYNFHELR
ncbi:competence type IV pilus minor pilin ComGG [Oceanobacillus sp. J11TS1]|uniref:competence type IV pilus minor pilin ComGG n=1 Tax=Oceanobacillus sp. J11TS1 TaxID=2807191 RepID=UPI001BB38BCF|nr:competence type IV pilus minor pilin ComGG [Oceanobacillus sp. J11TS1]